MLLKKITHVGHPLSPILHKAAPFSAGGVGLIRSGQLQLNFESPRCPRARSKFESLGSPIGLTQPRNWAPNTPAEGETGPEGPKDFQLLPNRQQCKAQIPSKTCFSTYIALITKFLVGKTEKLSFQAETELEKRKENRPLHMAATDSQLFQLWRPITPEDRGSLLTSDVP